MHMKLNIHVYKVHISLHVPLNGSSSGIKLWAINQSKQEMDTFKIESFALKGNVYHFSVSIWLWVCFNLFSNG